MGDRQSLYAAAFVRSVSTGMIGVLLGVYLADLKLDATAIGVVIGVGLAGARSQHSRSPLARTGLRIGARSF
jgi:hypothetical protein